MHDRDVQPLIERDREVAALSNAMADAAEGHGSFVVIDGPAGLGKSRLLDAVRSEALADGVAVLSARGVELERQIPFGVSAELFVSEVAGAPPDVRAGLLAGHAGLAAAVLDPSQSGPDDAQALVRGLYWLTVNLAIAAAPKPVLMVVDDAHWADRPSLGFLAHLAVRVPDLPIVVAVATRTGEPGDVSDLLDWLLAQPDHQVLRLEGLSEVGIGQMVKAGLPAADPRFVHACAQVSGGNPFLARELVRSVHADGIPPTASSVAAIERLVPASVVHSVLVRLARLGEPGRLLAGAVAVLGDGASMRHAATLSGLETADAERAADALAGAHMFASEIPLRFAHPLIATAVSADLPAFARAGAHRRAADLLAADGASAEVIAAHLLLSAPDGEAFTVATLRRAAARTLARGDARAATHLLKRALAEPPPADERGDVLLELSDAEMQTGDPEAETHIEAALALAAEPAERLRPLVALVRLRFLLGDHENSAHAVQQALALLEDDDPIALDLVSDELNATLFQAPLRARAEMRVGPLLAGARAGELPDHPGLLAHLALRLALAGGPPSQVRDLAERATAANALVDPSTHGMLMGIVVQALVCVDELSLAEQIADAALELARRSGSVLSYATASFHRALPCYHRGALDDALADLDQALTAGNDGWPTADGWIGALQAHIHLARGDLVAARAALSLADGVAPTSLDHAIVRSARAELALAEHKHAEALEHAQGVGRQLIEEFGIDHPGLVPWRSTAAEAAFGLGQRDLATRLADEGLTLARRIAVPRAIGRALRTTARVADRDRTLELLREAVGELQQSPSVLERAYATVELGAALRRAGQRTAAQKPLRDGLQMADAIGAAVIADAARKELNATGARPRRAAWTGPDALTPTERRVAQLAAEGLTNPQIAQALFVTSKTIQTHLAHTYRKLAIESRHQLEAALAGPGDRLTSDPLG
jgi:DNA-binding NarL/FixJ family response regulator